MSLTEEPKVKTENQPRKRIIKKESLNDSDDDILNVN